MLDDLPKRTRLHLGEVSNVSHMHALSISMCIKKKGKRIFHIKKKVGCHIREENGGTEERRKLFEKEDFFFERTRKREFSEQRVVIFFLKERGT